MQLPRVGREPPLACQLPGCARPARTQDVSRGDQGGWKWAQHLEVLPRHRSTTTTADMLAAMVHEERKGRRRHRESRPRKFGNGIEEQRCPDPENNAKGAGGRGAPPSAIVNAEGKGKCSDVGVATQQVESSKVKSQERRSSETTASENQCQQLSSGSELCGTCPRLGY